MPSQLDFRLEESDSHGLEGLVAPFGIKCPGLTSSLAIGETVAPDGLEFVGHLAPAFSVVAYSRLLPYLHLTPYLTPPGFVTFMASAPSTSVKAVSSPSLSARVSASGRLSLPAEVRRQVGLEKGGVVRIDMLDGAIRIRTVDEIKAHIRQLARTSGLADKASVADFLSWRRDERSAEGHGAEE